MDFRPAKAGISEHETPKTGKESSFEKIAKIDFGPAVSFARESEHGIWSGFDAAANEAGKMHAKEGKFGVGYGIDEVADEELAVGTDLVVFAAERNDFGRRFAARGAHDAVGIQPGATDDELCLEIAG